MTQFTPVKCAISAGKQAGSGQADLSNLVGELGLRLSQDAGLGVVVALPGEVAGRAVAQPHKDGGHGPLHLLRTPLHAPPHTLLGTSACRIEAILLSPMQAEQICLFVSIAADSCKQLDLQHRCTVRHASSMQSLVCQDGLMNCQSACSLQWTLALSMWLCGLPVVIMISVGKLSKKSKMLSRSAQSQAALWPCYICA